MPACQIRVSMVLRVPPTALVASCANAHLDTVDSAAKIAIHVLLSHAKTVACALVLAVAATFASAVRDSKDPLVNKVGDQERNGFSSLLVSFQWTSAGCEIPASAVHAKTICTFRKAFAASARRAIRAIDARSVRSLRRSIDRVNARVCFSVELLGRW